MLHHSGPTIKMRINGEVRDIIIEGESSIFGVSIIARVDQGRIVAKYYVPTQWLQTETFNITAIASGIRFDKIHPTHIDLKLLSTYKG